MNKNDHTASLPTYAGLHYAWDENDPKSIASAWIPLKSRVLELGCGRGALSRTLLFDKQCDVLAVDLESGYREFLPDKNFKQADITKAHDQQELFQQTYDYVLLLDVLEHLVDPGTTLRQLVERAGPGVRFIISLPNILVWHVRRQLLRGIFEYEETGTLDRTHLRFFTPQSARRLLQGSGLSIQAERLSWNVPVVSQLWSYFQLCRDPETPNKLTRRLGALGTAVAPLVPVANALFSSGGRTALNMVGDSACRIAPSLFANHFVAIARSE